LVEQYYAYVISKKIIKMPKIKLGDFFVLTTIFSLLLWSMGLPGWPTSGEAAQLLSVSDTITDSDLSANAVHELRFTNVSPFTGDSIIKVEFDPTGQNFDLTGLALTDLFISGTGITQVANAGACGAGSAEVYASTVNTTNDYIEFTVCTGDTIPGSTAIRIAASGTPPVINNPGTAGSYVIRTVVRTSGGAEIDRGDCRVAIIDDVIVTAAVDTTLTFVISGVAENTTINDEAATTTCTTTTATLIPFGIIAPGAANSKIAAQQLNVTTNANNGFTVTVFMNQNLTSSAGADIDRFYDDDATATPRTWLSPSGVLDQEQTYGHMGITSEDDLNSEEFGNGTALYAGNFVGTSSPRAVFHHNGPADGSTPDKGQTVVGYRIEINALQQAGTDYTATLTYICTPVY
jgi:hypothetical protein